MEEWLIYLLVAAGILLISAIFGVAGGLVAVWLSQRKYERELAKIDEDIISIRNSEKGKNSVASRQEAKTAEAAKNERYSMLISDLMATGAKYMSMSPEEKAKLDMWGTAFQLIGKYPDLVAENAIGALKGGKK